MPTSLVFISHSSGDNALVKQIAEGLTARGVDLVLDVLHLEPDRPWRRDLHEWLARCTSGLVLLTQAVLDKPDWVLKEAIILGFRKDLEQQNFGLFWALGPGVTRQQFLDKGFVLAQFGDTQRMKSLAAPDQVDALVDELVTRLPPTPARTPFDELVEAVSDLLQVARNPKVTLKKLAQHLKLTVPAHWGPDRVRQLADGVARAILVSRDDGLKIHSLMEALSLWDKPDLERLAHLMAPHWVDLQPVARLRAVSQRLGEAGRQAAVCIPGAQVQQYTARMYLLRAFAGAKVVLVEAVDASSGDLFGDIRAEVCRAVRKSRLVDGGLGDDRVVKELRRWPEPIFVPLYTLPDDAVLAQLRNEFPRALFIAGGDDDGNDPPVVHAPQADSAELLLLHPPPPPIVERQEADDWKRARKYFV